MSKLLVLDINGVICYRKRLNKGVIIDNNDYEFIMITNNIIYVRKGIINFINKCSKFYDIAIWSSSSKQCFARVINYIESKLDKPFVFKWYNEDIKCKEKDLNLIELEYDYKIIVDDSLSKINKNKYYIHTSTYCETQKEDLNNILDILLNF